MGRKIGSKNKHHKEKPVKEKKEKGSIKQKQKQNQHQIVNVNINTRGRKKSSDDDNEKKKKKKNNFQSMIPNIIFNPSIAIPQGAPINRQETNPPFYDMNSLLQPVQQAIPQKIPIPQVVQQIQPSTTNIATTQGKIKEEINPVNPVIQNPIEQYVPNPQTDQSHPLITPELVIDSNVTTPTHEKHMQHKKNIQDITPQVPKEVKQPKYKDTEGLGHRIPIQRIGEIAAAIGAGALTGGVTAAGEALVTGGLGALTAEGIAGSAIGGGVGAGVYNALGNTGEVGHIVSGIAGAVTGRAAGRTIGNRTRTRARTATSAQDEHPLLFTGPRNTLGGNRTGRSRLIEPEIQETHDPVTGEITRWAVPRREEQTIMNRIRRTADRANREAAETVSNISNQISDASRTAAETVSNIRNQISEAGENIVRRVRGRPRSRVPASDEEGWNQYSRNDEIERDNNAASRIKASIKRNKENKTLGNMRWENEMAQNEQNRNAANTLTAALKRSKARNNHVFDVMAENAAKTNAAATLQGAIKRSLPGHKLLKEHYKKLDKSDKATANFQNLTQTLGDVEQFGKQQDLLNRYQVKKQNIENFEKLVKNQVKTANMVATKKDIIDGRAAEILQAMARRKGAKKELTNKKMENAGDILGAVKKERASNRLKANVKTKLTYQFKDAKAALEPKYTGEPLVVLKGTEGNPNLILKKNHDRGVKAAEHRQMREELQEKYKDIMKKPYKDK